MPNPLTGSDDSIPDTQLTGGPHIDVPREAVDKPYAISLEKLRDLLTHYAVPLRRLQVKVSDKSYRYTLEANDGKQYGASLELDKPDADAARARDFCFLVEHHAQQLVKSGLLGLADLRPVWGASAWDVPNKPADPARVVNVAGSEKEVSGKLRYDLVDPFALAWLAASLTYGAAKYAADNWRGFSEKEFWDLYYPAVLRHLEAARVGELDDPESGMPHLAGAMFGVMVLCAKHAPRSLPEVLARTREAIRRARATRAAQDKPAPAV